MTGRQPSRLLVINQYYAPDIAATGRLAAELCAGLVRHGIEVHVITGQPSYSTVVRGAPSYEILDDVHVHRVHLGDARGRERMGVRLLGYARFLRGAWRVAVDVVESWQPDAVLTFHNPPFVGAIGARLAQRYHLRYTYVLQDIHPDILVATGWIRLPRAASRAWDWVNRWILNRAENIVVLGEGMKRTLVESKGVTFDRVHVIPPWGRPELKPQPRSLSLRRELGVADRDLLLLCAGNMGIMHPLDSLLDAAALCRDRPVQFLLVGDGASRQQLVARVEAERLVRVTFVPYQPEPRFVQLIAAADACFVGLLPGLERLAVPSRAFTFLSAGRPLISLMSPEADVASLVSETACGWNVTSAEELAQLLRNSFVTDPSWLSAALLPERSTRHAIGVISGPSCSGSVKTSVADGTGE